MCFKNTCSVSGESSISAALDSEGGILARGTSNDVYHILASLLSIDITLGVVVGR